MAKSCEYSLSEGTYFITAYHLLDWGTYIQSDGTGLLVDKLETIASEGFFLDRGSPCSLSVIRRFVRCSL